MNHHDAEQPRPRDVAVTDASQIEPEYDAEHEWMLSARCRQLPPGTFFPSDGIGVEIAQRECAQCPVRLECLEYALENRIDHGVWGGASERERRRILRRRRGLTPAR